jgi:LEA14-like dessication related protein
MKALPGLLLVIVAALSLGACASLRQTDPLQVTVAGIEGLQGEGLELRLLVKVRIQNPNDQTIEYDGAYLKLEVFNKTFATGVSDATGTVPRFGEAVVAVPVTVSVLRMVRQVLGVVDGQRLEKIPYELTGKLNSAKGGSYRFETKGELELPRDTPGLTAPGTVTGSGDELDSASRH